MSLSEYHECFDEILSLTKNTVDNLKLQFRKRESKLVSELKVSKKESRRLGHDVSRYKETINQQQEILDMASKDIRKSEETIRVLNKRLVGTGENNPHSVEDHILGLEKRVKSLTEFGNETVRTLHLVSANRDKLGMERDIIQGKYEKLKKILDGFREAMN